MSSVTSDTDAIAAKIDGYLEGCRTGAKGPLESAFHPDARMYGAVGSDRYDVPIFGGMDQAVSDQPTVDHEAEILSIDVEGDAACVKLAESRFWGQDFVDFFLLSRIDGEWQIVAKAFTHGGASS